MLQSLGHGIEEAANDRAALRRVERGNVGLVLSAVDPADPDALELTSYLRRKHTRVPVILLFANPSCERAREATRLGAAVLRYPAPANELRATVTQALQVWRDDAPPPIPAAMASADHRTTAEAHPDGAAPSNGHSNGNGHGHGAGHALFDGVAARPSLSKPIGVALVGDAPGLRQSVELALTAAATRTPVVMIGEQGTGKSTIARAIHAASPRADRPFAEVVCGGLDESQLERELFGQSFGRAGGVDGMFDRPGKVARAAGGTLFLDEVAALTPTLQRHLLRLLQDGEFEPVGGHESIRADVRLILASSENLPSLVEQGRLRRDLYDRIGVVCLRLPPLRDRGGDIEALAKPSRPKFAASAKPVAGFYPSDALDLLCRHDWPRQRPRLEEAMSSGGGSSTRGGDLGQPLARLRPAPALPAARLRRPSPRLDRPPAPEGGPGGAREADHHPGAPGPELEPPGDRPGPGYQPDYPLQEDEEIRPADRRARRDELTATSGRATRLRPAGGPRRRPAVSFPARGA